MSEFALIKEKTTSTATIKKLHITIISKQN